jgi:hypothetical protein
MRFSRIIEGGGVFYMRIGALAWNVLQTDEKKF